MNFEKETKDNLGKDRVHGNLPEKVQLQAEQQAGRGGGGLVH